MWLIAISVMVCVMAAGTDSQLHCPHSGSQHTCSKSRNGRFFLDGYKINIQYDDDKFIMNCGDYQALDSEVLPFFTDEYHSPLVKLGKCPLPAGNSIVGALRLINVHLIPTGNETTLALNHLPPEPPFATSHFSGLEHLTKLEIKAQSELAISVDVFASLISVRTLKLSHISLFEDSGTKLPLIVPDALERLVLIDSRDKKLPVMGRCDSLRQFELYKPIVQVLPERWVAACPNLEKITIKSADKLSSLPSNLLQGANALKRLLINRCTRIKSLPEGFLAGAPNLMSLELTYNKLKTLSSTMFLGPKLNSLSLTGNQLKLEDLKVLGSLTSLTKLELGKNQDLKHLCDENGYSPLRKLVQLRTLSFWEADITNICRDWRESMTFLETLDLRDTAPMVLTFADLQFTRDATVHNAKVEFEDVSDFFDTYTADPPISSIVLTEEDYKHLLNTPSANSPVEFIWSYSNIDCDCQLYWTRKAMDLPNFKTPIRMDRIKCKNNRYLKNMTSEEICPERA